MTAAAKDDAFGVAVLCALEVRGSDALAEARIAEMQRA